MLSVNQYNCRQRWRKSRSLLTRFLWKAESSIWPQKWFSIKKMTPFLCITNSMKVETPSFIRLRSSIKNGFISNEVDYWHIKYGNGTILLNNKFENIGKVLKPEPLNARLKVEGDFPGLLIQNAGDIGDVTEDGTRYVLRWETIKRNRDRAPEKPWPSPSQLYLYKLKIE